MKFLIPKLKISFTMSKDTMFLYNYPINSVPQQCQICNGNVKTFELCPELMALCSPCASVMRTHQSTLIEQPPLNQITDETRQYCPCGGHFLYYQRQKHYKSKMHQQYLLLGSSFSS